MKPLPGINYLINSSTTNDTHSDTEPLPNPPCLKSSNSFSWKHIPHLTPDENDTPSPSVRVEEKSGETNRLASRKISRRKWVEDNFVDIPKCFVDFSLYQQHHHLFRICSGVPFILHGDRKITYFSPKEHFSYPQKLACFFNQFEWRRHPNTKPFLVETWFHIGRVSKIIHPPEVPKPSHRPTCKPSVITSGLWSCTTMNAYPPQN